MQTVSSPHFVCFIWLTALTAFPVKWKLLTIFSSKALIFHSNAKHVINFFIDGSVVYYYWGSNMSLELTLCLEIDDTVYNACILKTFSCVGEDVFTTVVGWLTQSRDDMTDFETPPHFSPFLFPQWTYMHMSTHIHPGKAERRSIKWDAKYCRPCDMEGEKTDREKTNKRRSRPNHWPWWEACGFTSLLMVVLIFLQHNVTGHSQ